MSGAAPAERRRGIAIAVHDLAQARAALAAADELGVEVELWSAPGAAAYAGIGYLQALGQAAGRELRIDCGEDAGLVMAALRVGCRRLAFAGAPPVAAKLADMAAQAGADLRLDPAPPAALCAPEDDAGAVVRALFNWPRPTPTS
jgi:hypothetical protein